MAAPRHAERCRTLAEGARTGTLATLARDPAGFPYGSLVTVAFDLRGRPLLLLSSLAEHTANLGAHAEASLLVAENRPTQAGDGEADPLTAGRMTLLGTCRPVDRPDVPAVRALFLAKHPKAALYVDFTDFAFYRLEPSQLRYVGGFGRMSWVPPEAYAHAEPDPLAPHASGILAHMNDDHGAALLAYAKGIARIEGATAATMTAVDRYGFEMTVATPDGRKYARLAFDAPVTGTDEVRRVMVALVARARAEVAKPPAGAAGE